MIVERILQIIDYKGLNKRQFYLQTGLSNGFLDKVKDVGVSKLELILSTYSEINPNWLLTGKGEMLKSNNDALAFVSRVHDKQEGYSSKKSIPLIPYSAIGGFGTGEVEPVMNHDILDRYVVPGLKKVDFLIKVDGDSMLPAYQKGDVVACQMINDGAFIQWGKTFVLNTDQGVLLKRLQPGKSEMEYVCESDNQKYKPFVINKKEVLNIALVKGLIRIE